jgi:hypothetical protein
LALGYLGALRLAPNGVDPGGSDGLRLYPTALEPTYYGQFLALLSQWAQSNSYLTKGWPWDWRKELVGQGQLLANAIIAGTDPSSPATIVGHSAGGLVARAAWAALAAAGATDLVRRIITLGTPHQGSYSPLRAYSHDWDGLWALAALSSAAAQAGFPPAYPGASRIYTQTDICILCGTFPAFYECLPSLGGPDQAGDPLRTAIYTAPQSPTQPFSEPWLTYAASTFSPWLLSPASLPPPSVLTTVAGVGLPTVGHLLVPSALGTPSAYGGQVEGDGTVTETSATIGTGPAYRLIASHMDLPTLAMLWGYLPQWILASTPPPPPPPTPPLLSPPSSLLVSIPNPPMGSLGYGGPSGHTADC